MIYQARMYKTDIKTNFWEEKFRSEKTSWGFEPANSALYARDLFVRNNLKNILIPGIGYGRNARIFIEQGINVSGIEISKSAIDLARKVNNLNIMIHHGSVTDMPFSKNKYDGIFCYALIHLLNQPERRKFIKNCFNQLVKNGIMVFTVISKNSAMYGSGKPISKDRFKITNGLNVFFYDDESAKKEFGNFGMKECREFDEPIKHMKNEPPLKCLLITCKK